MANCCYCNIWNISLHTKYRVFLFTSIDWSNSSSLYYTTLYFCRAEENKGSDALGEWTIIKPVIEPGRRKDKSMLNIWFSTTYYSPCLLCPLLDKTQYQAMPATKVTTLHTCTYVASLLYYPNGAMLHFPRHTAVVISTTELNARSPSFLEAHDLGLIHKALCSHKIHTPDGLQGMRPINERDIWALELYTINCIVYVLVNHMN